MVGLVPTFAYSSAWIRARVTWAARGILIFTVSVAGFMVLVPLFMRLVFMISKVITEPEVEIDHDR